MSAGATLRRWLRRPPPPLVRDFRMACEFCPSQWEGYLENGHSLYVRYRFGCLTVSVSEAPSDDIGPAIFGHVLLARDIGDQWAGCMTTEEMQRHTRGVLRWPEP